MAVHSWSIIEVDITDTVISTTTLSTNGVFMIQHVPSEEQIDSGDTVTESLHVLFEAYSGSDAIEIAEVVRQKLTLAKRNAEMHYGNQYYLLFSRSDESATWRSRIINGVIQWDSRALEAYGSGKLEAFIVVERDAFWERHDTTTALATSTALDNVGTLVALTDPGGTLPTPLKVELLLNEASTPSPTNWYMAVNTDSVPASLDNVLPGRTTSSWSAADVHTIERYTETLGQTEDTNLDELRGEPFYIMVCCTSVTGAWYLRANINTLLGASKVPRAWTNEAYVSDAGIVVLGPVRIPPVPGWDDLANWTLSLTTRNDATTGDFVADRIVLMPASDYRHIVQTGYAIAQNDIMTDDGIRGINYIYDNSDGKRQSTLEPRGRPLTVTPGSTKSLHFLFDEDDDFDSTVSFLVTVTCRQRRASL